MGQQNQGAHNQDVDVVRAHRDTDAREREREGVVLSVKLIKIVRDRNVNLRAI